MLPVFTCLFPPLHLLTSPSLPFFSPFLSPLFSHLFPFSHLSLSPPATGVPTSPWYLTMSMLVPQSCGPPRRQTDCFKEQGLRREWREMQPEYRRTSRQSCYPSCRDTHKSFGERQLRTRIQTFTKVYKPSMYCRQSDKFTLPEALRLIVTITSPSPMLSHPGRHYIANSSSRSLSPL